MAEKPRLHVIPGTPAPESPAEKVRKRIRAMPRAPGVIQCHRCTGMEVIESRIGATWESGRAKGGTKVLLCVSCLMKGERVVLG